MTSRLKVVILCAAGLALACAALVAFAPGQRETLWLTDGADIHVRAAEEPPRRVLWTPARPVREGTDIDEYEPKVSSDGTTMVLVRRKPGQNADLFTSRWTPSGWTDPAPVSELNTEQEELGPEFSFDGSAIYFYSDRPGGLGGYDIWVSRLDNGSWGTPVNLGPTVNSTWNDYGPALSPDGRQLFLSSNRPRPDEPAPRAEAWDATIREQRSRHDYDLYVSRLNGDEPSAVEPLGGLNTAADEGAPAVSPVGDFLYFASDRAGGQGGFDLYRARIRREALDAPEPLGRLVNSAENDLDPGLSTDGFRLYFSSDRPKPSGATEAIEAITTPAPARYALWQSSSREVYDEIERTSQASWLWSLPWKWLALLLAALAPLALLLWLLRKEEWRRRFMRLSLLAQCLIISLIAHALLASLLAVWRVGSGIADLVQEGGGGTRVILAGSESIGGSDGSIEGQILASGVDVPMPEAPPLSAPLFEAGRIDSPIVQATPPASPSLTAVPIAFADAPLTSPEPSLRVVTAAPATSSGASIPGVPDRPAPQPETSSYAPPPASPTAPLPTSPVASAPVAMPLAAPVTVGERVALLQAPATEAPARSISQPGATMPAPAPAIGASAGVVAAVSVPPSAAPARNEEMANSARAIPPTAPMAAAPSMGSDVRSPMVHVPLPSEMPASNPTRATPLAAVAASSPSGTSAPSAFPLVGAAPAPSGGGFITAAIPSAKPAPTTGGSAGTAEPSSDAASGALKPLTPRIANGVSSSSRSVRIDPPAPGSPNSTGPALGPTLTTGPASDHATGGGLSRTPTAPLPTLGGTTLDAMRLPEFPSEPVTPLETFAQRAPEVRGEILRQTGGSSETEKAVGRALEWFSRNQEPDGRWSSRKHGGEIDADAAMTGMALLCYLGAGHTHLRDGPYRENVARGLTWLRARQDSSGDLRRGETMYGQTVATVALCEALAMTNDQSLAGPARAAVQLVLSRATGERSRDDRDTSVIGWLVFTVESARRAGIAVPANVFDAAGKWLDSVAQPGTPGRYSYRRGEPASAAMTAEAMFVRQLLGHTRNERRMQESARFILRTPPRWQEGAPTHYWYYATLALFQHQGEEWKQWNDELVRELLAHQSQEGELAGSWAPKDQWSRMGGRVYQTAVCTLSLEVYYRYRAE